MDKIELDDPGITVAYIEWRGEATIRGKGVESLEVGDKLAALSHSPWIPCRERLPTEAGLPISCATGAAR